MKHFTMEAWADFARGVVGKEQESLMQSHLDDGCPRCVSAASLWQRVHATAERQGAAIPPENVVRTVKAMYAARGLAKGHAPQLAIAQLLFDSFRGPQLAGVRSAGLAPRQLLFGEGDHRIDLRLEPQVDSEKVSLVGQILDSTNPGKGLEEISVVLLKGRKVLAEASTNRFGEFHLQCDLESRLELRVKLPQGKEVSIALVEPASGPSAEVQELADSIGVRKVLRRRSTKKT
jgi:hypothetical protein